MPAPISKEEHQRRLDLLNAGMTREEMAAEIGVKPAAISQWCDKYGLEPPRRKKVTFHQDNRMELYLQGKTDREIADTLGVSPNSIAMWRKREGFQPNKKIKPVVVCIEPPKRDSEKVKMYKQELRKRFFPRIDETVSMSSARLPTRMMIKDRAM